MYFNNKLQNVDVVCINLTTRLDRRAYFRQQMKNKKIDFKFHNVKPNNDPKKGCLLSHMSVIKDAIQRKKEYLLIFEDDAKIIKDISTLPLPSDDWDMLYLGGTVHQNFGKVIDDDNWTRVATWTCHAYMINLKNKELVKTILDAEKQEKEIDEYYIKNVHYKYKCYMITPMRVIQRDGYSDIEKTKLEYAFMEGTLEGLHKPEFEKTTGGNLALKVDFIPPELLPHVSIITPTFNRRKMFPMAIRNFQLFEYPRNKLEWIIIDDSDDIDKSVSDILPKDSRIKYVPIKGTGGTKLSVAHKRNIGNKEAKYDYIIHMDDDDYYPPGSIMIRVKMLLQYKSKGIECVGCSRVGIYDIIQNKSSIATDGNMSLSEASMAYTKNFWSSQNFNELETEGEYKSFINGRLNKILDMPYSYIIIAMVHKNNFTGTTKRIDKNVLVNKETQQEMNFYDTFDEETQDFINNIRRIL